MSERTERHRVAPETVGQEGAPEPRSGRAAGSWFAFGALTWSVVIGLALVFALAIVVAAL